MVTTTPYGELSITIEGVRKTVNTFADTLLMTAGNAIAHISEAPSEIRAFLHRRAFKLKLLGLAGIVLTTLGCGLLTRTQSDLKPTPTPASVEDKPRWNIMDEGTFRVGSSAFKLLEDDKTDPYVLYMTLRESADGAHFGWPVISCNGTDYNNFAPSDAEPEVIGSLSDFCTGLLSNQLADLAARSD